MSKWLVEQIPDCHDLYRRFHRNWLRKGKLKPGFFVFWGSGMSVEWSKYSTPADARNRAREPAANGVVSMRAGEVRAIDDLSVEHTPSNANRAHSTVYGEKDEEVRLKLRRVYGFVIKPAG